MLLASATFLITWCFVSTVIATQSYVWDKPFEMSTSCDNTHMCAMTTPSVQFPIVPDPSSLFQLPPNIQCLSFCKVDPQCLGTNYFVNTNTCAHYHYKPCMFLYQQNCIYYQIVDSTAGCISCVIQLQSSGLDDTVPPALYAYINVNNVTVLSITRTPNYYRGVTTMILDPQTCNASSLINFDTCGDSTAGTRLANYVSGLPTGIILLSVSFDDTSHHLVDATSVFTAAGVSVGGVARRGKLAFALLTGSPQKSVQVIGPDGGIATKLNFLLKGTLSQNNVVFEQCPN